MKFVLQFSHFVFVLQAVCIDFCSVRIIYHPNWRLA